VSDHQEPVSGAGVSGDALWGDLDRRGLVAACSDTETLRRRLREGPTGFYVGFDPTADSLHVGSLLPMAVARRVLAHGHRAVLLVGGATGMIGDPSGRSQGRVMLEAPVLNANCAALRAQLGSLVGEAAVVVDNRDWLANMSALDLLGDVGRHFPVNAMLARESVKARRDVGLSFTEFSYQVLQAYDFWWLRLHLGVEVQLGGSDQWGNITAGIDFMRRKDASTGWGLVWPLLTKADGTKFGKTAEGNVWLDARLTSPFAFWLFWFNTDDADVEASLLRFSSQDPDDIAALAARHRAEPARHLAQRVLANELTSWVHGPGLAASAQAAAGALFSDGPLDAGALDLVESEIGALRLRRSDLLGAAITTLAVKGGLCASLAEARRVAAAGGLHLGGTAVPPTRTLAPEDLHQPGWALVRKGRKAWLLLRATD